MAIQRWDPVRDLVELQNRLNRMFEDVLSRSDGSGDGIAAGWHPPVDLHEEPNRYVLRVDLPGVTADEVDIQIENGMLRLRGERGVDESETRENHMRV
ncbi:MAG: Hsp20/alpha crystallin family protein, partial [Acidobacteriota bacterium]|nr:Hsp20/alpha crystallin family protein [Acidobacteriota bacterium]